MRCCLVIEALGTPVGTPGMSELMTYMDVFVTDDRTTSDASGLELAVSKLTGFVELFI